MKKYLVLIVSVWALLLAACTENKSKEADIETSATVHAEIPVAVQQSYKIGDVVPHDEVCMVNNAFMGKKQIEVNFNGKVYYGCCEMCQKRIPDDETARIAIDPVSKKEVDKADAIIAITGDKGEVAYFVNKTNYKAFFN